jgi:hypothetical protein
MIPTFQLKVDDYDGEDGEEEENEEEVIHKLFFTRYVDL